MKQIKVLAVILGIMIQSNIGQSSQMEQCKNCCYFISIDRKITLNDSDFIILPDYRVRDSYEIILKKYAKFLVHNLKKPTISLWYKNKLIKAEGMRIYDSYMPKDYHYFLTDSNTVIFANETTIYLYK